MADLLLRCPGPRSQDLVLPLGRRGVSARLCSFWRPQERSHFLAFSNLEKLPTLLGLWLLASSVMTDICLCPIPSLLASLTYGPCDNTGPTCIIQKHLNPMTSAKSFLSCEVPWLHSWLIWPGYRATGWAALGSCPPGSGATSLLLRCLLPEQVQVRQTGTQVARGFCCWGLSSSELQEFSLLPPSDLAVLGSALDSGLWGKLCHAAPAWGQYAWGWASTVLPGSLSAAE